MKQLLRLTMVGSVDDGKSTLIGRLLRDCGAVYDDQLEAVARASRGGMDFSLITDGLRAEREQGITIDVAYRYFATERRKFIVADTPGHEQYTRNMATGASIAQLAVVLIDARNGPLPQTSRHAYITWLLGIRNIIVVVNKMDLVEFSHQVFKSIRQQVEAIAKKLPDTAIQFIPVVAVDGDNVARRSSKMPWYDGPSLLEYLERVPVESDPGIQPFRMPVQYVIRSGNHSRAYAGQILSGSIAPGEAVILLPSRKRARVESIPTYDGNYDRAFAPMSTSLCLDGHWDISRGDMLADANCPPHCAQSFRASIIWMSESPLAIDRTYLIKHTSQCACATVLDVQSKLDIATLDENSANDLRLNDIGVVTIETHRPIFFDSYSANRHTGSFILIDPKSNLTVAAGLITAACEAHQDAHQSTDEGLTVWFTGLSSAGKTTLSRAVYARLQNCGRRIELLDGDEIRSHLCRDLGFSKEDRDENIRRIGFVAELLSRNGVVVLVSAISPYRAVREEIRMRIRNFVEVYVNASLETCERRDVKGLYHKARAGLISGLTGLDDPYEPPAFPEVECQTDQETLAQSVEKVLEIVQARLQLTPCARECP